MNRLHVFAYCLVVAVGCQKDAPTKATFDDDKGPGLPPGYYDNPPVNVEVFRSWILSEKQVPVLLRHFEAVSPLCHKVLTDSSSQSYEISGTLHLVAQAKGDRSQFVGTAVELLGHKKNSVRQAAAECLAAIGGERECAPISLLLRDEDNMVRLSAAKALAAIGGEREVAVFDLTRKMAERAAADGKSIITPEDLERFDKFREKLVARLKQVENDKPKAPPPEKK